MNREIRRRTRVVGAFPNGNSALMLLCARLRYDPEKRTNTKKAAKQGNAGERPDAAAEYTVKSSGVVSCFSYFTSILQLINPGVRGALPQWGRCHEVTEGLTDRQEPRIAPMLLICPQNRL